MRQEIIVAKPPVYDRCVEVFGASVIEGKPILWSWGGAIYNPLDIDIPRELLAHEAVHGERQGANERSIHTWWDRYLTEREFRYEEERVAHRAEWATVRRWSAGRNLTAQFDGIAARLASPLYGKLVSIDGAKFALTGKD